MKEPVYILGGGRTDFKRNLKKEGKTIRDLITEAGRKAIEDAKIDPAEIEAAAVGNFNAGQFTKQLHLGAFVPEIDPKLHGIPTMHTEAACASGAMKRWRSTWALLIRPSASAKAVFQRASMPPVLTQAAPTCG